MIGIYIMHPTQMASVTKNWEHFIPRFAKQWNLFTQDEISDMNGDSEAIITHIQRRYNLSREDAEKELTTWLNEQNS